MGFNSREEVITELTRKYIDEGISKSFGGTGLFQLNFLSPHKKLIIRKEKCQKSNLKSLKRLVILKKMKKLVLKKPSKMDGTTSIRNTTSMSGSQVTNHEKLNDLIEGRTLSLKDLINKREL